MKKYIIGNWKLNLSPAESISLASKVKEISINPNIIVGITPTALSLLTVLNEVRPSANFWVGAQNAYHQASGAFTGEISSAQVASAGANFVIIGHSERRQVFNESQELITNRLAGVLASGLCGVYCIGETLAEREAGITNDILAKQLKPVMEKISDSSKIIIAYEPVWAIGTGKTASLEDIISTHGFIKSFWNNCPPILYGGSVTPDNAKEILQLPVVSGALVGGASLVVDKFSKIIAAAN